MNTLIFENLLEWSGSTDEEDDEDDEDDEDEKTRNGWLLFDKAERANRLKKATNRATKETCKKV